MANRSCPICLDAVLPSDIDEVLARQRSNCGDSCRVRMRHGHRLYLVTTGSCVRLMWATERADIEATLRSKRGGQPMLAWQGRVATYADLRRLVDARTATRPAESVAGG